MARQPRVEYPGAIYHVMNRGDRRGQEDGRLFVTTLGEACEKTGWEVHAFCLMPNHFHLVIETPQANLSAGMQWFLGSGAWHCNCNKEKDLPGQPKAAAGMIQIARRLRRESVVPFSWIAKRLSMGSRTYAQNLVYTSERRKF